MSRPSLLLELQRRNVHRAALFYAGAAWLLVQIATQVFPFFDIPNETVRIVVIAVVIGFPFAMLFSWFYEWTPQGIKLESEIDRSESVTRQTGKTMDRWIIAVLALAVVLLLTDRLALRKPAAASADKSIAVLPFENLSADAENAYFATGIQDEILTRLAKVGALHVTSRTSTAEYSGHPGNLKEIAARLGVAHILEGSVQKVGNKVRINVQLIRAADDTHLWGEIYDRGTDDILGVQGEVATAIAQTLDARLSGEERQQLARKPTLNPAAYDAYLRGLEGHKAAFSPVLLRAASENFAEAVRLDPGFAQAWAYKSIVDGLIHFNRLDLDSGRLEASRSEAAKAMELAPEAAESWLARGYLLYRTLDFDGARTAFAEAGQRLPNSAEVFGARGLVERRAGHYERSIELLQQAIALDPGNISFVSMLVQSLSILGRTAASRIWLDRGLALNPGNAVLISQKAGSYLDEGDIESAGRLLDSQPLDIESGWMMSVKLSLATVRRDFSTVIAGYRAALAAPDFELDGGTLDYYPLLGWSQRWQGDEKAATATFKEGLARIADLRERLGGDSILQASLAMIEAGLGDSEAARRDARLAVESAGNDQIASFATRDAQTSILALAGLRDEALDALGALADDPTAQNLADLRLSPIWDGYRDDPRFKQALAKAEAKIARQNQATVAP